MNYAETIVEVPPDGWIVIYKIGKYFLLFVITLALTLTMQRGFQFEIPHNLEWETKVLMTPLVSITADNNFISGSAQQLENGETLITSNSTVPVNVEVKPQSGERFLVASGLPPGDSFVLRLPAEPCLVTFSATN